jgi:hypothetical protein
MATLAFDQRDEGVEYEYEYADEDSSEKESASTQLESGFRRAAGEIAIESASGRNG